MYVQSVFVDEVSEQDRDEFFKSVPFLKTIDLPVSDDMVARFKAVRMVNAQLPVHECVTKVLSSVSDGNGFAVRVNILD